MAKKDTPITESNNDPILMTDNSVRSTPPVVKTETAATTPLTENRPGLRQIAKWYKFPLLVLLLSLVFVGLLLAAYNLGQRNPDENVRYDTLRRDRMLRDYDGYGPHFAPQRSTPPNLQTN